MAPRIGPCSVTSAAVRWESLTWPIHLNWSVPRTATSTKHAQIQPAIDHRYDPGRIARTPLRRTPGLRNRPRTLCFRVICSRLAGPRRVAAGLASGGTQQHARAPPLPQTRGIRIPTTNIRDPVRYGLQAAIRAGRERHNRTPLLRLPEQGHCYDGGTRAPSRLETERNRANRARIHSPPHRRFESSGGSPGRRRFSSAARQHADRWSASPPAASIPRPP